MDKVEGRIAVLGVAIAGVLASIVEPGIYTLGSTVVGLTLVLLLLAYDTHPEDETHQESVAYSGVLALTLVLIFGYPLNWLFFDPKCTEHIFWQMVPPWGEYCFHKRLQPRPLDTYDVDFFLIWFVSTMIAWFYRRKWGLTRTRRRRVEERSETQQRAAQLAQEHDRLEEEHSRLQSEAERLRDELEAERSKGLWARLFGS